MSTDLKKKQYGLVLTKKTEKTLVRPAASIFADDDDDSEKVDVSGKIQSASTLRVQKHAERLQEMAIAEDPTIFDYDASYEQIQAARDEKIAERKKADKERKSKYALDIIKAHKRRELEQQSREERLQQKERAQEGDEFADKEVFVTGAYRKQMEEVQKFREEEAYEKRFNELTSVEHQKAWQAGFGRTLLNELARGEQSLMQKGSLHNDDGEGATTAKEKETTASKTKIRNVRRRNVSDQQSSDEEKHAAAKSSQPKGSKTKTAEKKSIYSDDEDDNQPKFEPPKRNFPGELKPGLNRVVKAPTKSEKLKERQFTPTPPSSDDEDKHHQRRRREKTEEKLDKRRISNDRKESTESLKKRIEPKKDDKQQRLIRLKEILKQRNGPEQIEEFRRRYLERKESGIVIPPL